MFVYPEGNLTNKIGNKYVCIRYQCLQFPLIENEILKLNNSFALASPLSDDLIDFVKNNSFDKFLKILDV